MKAGTVSTLTVFPGSHVCVLSLFSRVRLFVTPWTVAGQASLSTGFSRQEYWSGLPCPPPEDLSDPGIEPASLMSPALAGGFFTTGATWEALVACVSAPASSMLLSSTYVLHVPNSILEMKQERLREVQQLFQGHRAELGFPPGPLSLGCFARLPVQ